MTPARRSGKAAAILVLFAALLAAGVFAWQFNRAAKDTRVPIVFWGHPTLGDDIYTLIHEFERQNPQYHVIMGSAVAEDTVGDAQRLLSSIAGGVPPDVVWFDRFAIGEWAGRNALTDLTPYLKNQAAADPYAIDLKQYYPWAIAEASYKPPGASDPPRIYGIPTEADVRIFYANSDLLRQAGYVDGKGEPVLPKNWDELRDYARKLTRFNIPGDKSSGIARLGFAPNTGNSWLYLYAWQAGGEFLNSTDVVGVDAQGRSKVWPAFTRCTMNSPPVIRAMHWMSSVYDEVGTFGQVKGFEQSGQPGAMDHFVIGNIAMKTDGDSYMDRIAWWRPTMDFVVCPPPMPQDQLELGKGPVSWSGGFALVIPATAHQKDGAFKLIQYLYSWEAISLMEQGKREQKLSEGKFYLPKGLANRVFYERLVKQYITDNPDVPPRFRQAYEVIQKLMPRTRIRPVTPVGQLLWNQHVRACDAGMHHAYADEAKRTGRDEFEIALSNSVPEVQRQLDDLMAPPPPNQVRWGGYFALYGLFIAAPFALMLLVYRRRKKI